MTATVVATAGSPTDRMTALLFRVAGVTLRISGDEDLLAPLRVLYAAFPPGDDSPGASFWTIAWQGAECRWGRTGEPPRLLRVAALEFRASATMILLGPILSEQRPDLLILHGNGLLGPDGTLILLVGDSGAGKTTLSMELNARGYEPFAEDLLLIEDAGAWLLPFPRAAALRDGGPADAPVLEGYGGGRASKPLVAPDAASPEPVTLAKARLVMLGPAPVADAPVGGGETAWATWTQVDGIDEVEAAGLPLAKWELNRQMAVLEFDRALAPEERVRLAAILEAHGGLILHTDLGPPVATGPMERPPSPICTELASADAILACLRHLRRATAEAAARPPGEAFMRLARAFSQASCHRLVPGGTPAETIDLLLERLRA